MSEFRKISGSRVDLVPYVQNYLHSHSEKIDLMVGCDSQNRGRNTTYAVVVAMYTPGHGAHVIFDKWNTPKERTKSTRLMNEVWSSIKVAEELREAGIPKPKWIDLDLNPDPKYDSNSVLKQAVGFCEGMGYDVRFKTLGPLVTTMADSLVKH